ncbi:MAG: AarF/UbiB family protein, partial [Phycisphaerales bacterium]|nr:AarF/UbiB family protein [Phycisphaerales bacterium]
YRYNNTVNRTDHCLVRDCLAKLPLASFLPDENRAFAELIVEGLAFFLERLPADRLLLLLNEQASLVDRAAPERLVALLGHCPTLHKLGQVVARDRRLALPLRRRLQQLESMSPSTPIEHVRELLQRELPEEALTQVRLDHQPIAEASVAVVVPFEYHRRDADMEIRGIFKVLRPGVADRLSEELAVFSELGSFLEDRCESLGLPAIDYRETLERVRDLLVHEVRLDGEQSNLAEAAVAFGGASDVVIPGLLPFCTPGVTAMTFVEGPTLAEVVEAGGAVARRTARAIVEALIARPLFALEADALFHADPHAGNILLTPDGRLGLIDWSLAGRLGKDVRERVVQMMLGGATLDGERIGRAIEALSLTTPDASTLRAVISDALRVVRIGIPPGLKWLTHLLDRAVLSGRVRFSDDLLLFRKSLLTLEGVIADLDESCPIDAILLTEASQRLIQEWPARFMNAPTSRAFSTHLSTFDLAGFLWSGPASLLRFWSGCTR